MTFSSTEIDRGAVKASDLELVPWAVMSSREIQFNEFERIVTSLGGYVDSDDTARRMEDSVRVMFLSYFPGLTFEILKKMEGYGLFVPSNYGSFSYRH